MADRAAGTMLGQLATTGTRPNRLLRFGLLSVAIAISAYAGFVVLRQQPIGMDLRIPLDAAERWLQGSVVYDPASFTDASTTGLPFLYPPFLLPLLAPLTAMPQGLAIAVWTVLLVACALAAMRRLAIPLWAGVALLGWAPLLEGWLAGNVQVLLFALFVWLFTAGSRGHVDQPFRPVLRDPADPAEPRARTGMAAASIGALKVGQVHPWLYVATRRPSAALVGAGIIVGAIAATLPLTGLELWADWITQLGRAADPAWRDAGFALGRLAQPLGWMVAVICLVLVPLVPRRDAGVSVGVLSVVGAMSLRIYGALFLLPGILVVRREIGIVVFGLLGLYTIASIWAGIVILAATWVVVLASGRLREP